MTTDALTDIQHFFEQLYPGVEDGYLVLSRPDPDPTHSNPKNGKRWLRSEWLDLTHVSLPRIAQIASTLSTQDTVYFGVAIQRPDCQPDPGAPQYQRGRLRGAWPVV